MSVLTHFSAMLIGAFVALTGYAIVKIGADAEKAEGRRARLNEDLDRFANETVKLWHDDELEFYEGLRDHYVNEVMEEFL